MAMLSRVARILRRDVSGWEAILRTTDGAEDEASLRKRGVVSYQFGHALFRAGRYGESVEHSARAATLLAGFPSLYDLVVHALALQGSALFLLGRHEESIAVCEQVVALRNPAPELLAQLEPDLSALAGRRRNYIADAWWYQVSSLEHLGRLQEADAAASALIDEFDPGETPGQQYVVAITFTARGRLARARGDLDSALAAFEESAVRASAHDSPKFALAECTALIERAEVLEQAAREDEALAACDELITRFRSSKDSDVQQAVADAVGLKARLAGPGARDRAT